MTPPVPPPPSKEKYMIDYLNCFTEKETHPYSSSITIAMK